MDLLSPSDHSISDGICPKIPSLYYTSVDHLANMILLEGQGSFMMEADIEEAYRMVPIHPQDQPILRVKWEGSAYIDKTLPFGLQSASKIFSTITNVIQCILNQKASFIVWMTSHSYVLVAKEKNKARHQKSQLMASFSELGVPIEPSKLECSS